jgi:hypothetical protein
MRLKYRVKNRVSTPRSLPRIALFGHLGVLVCIDGVRACSSVLSIGVERVLRVVYRGMRTRVPMCVCVREEIVEPWHTRVYGGFPRGQVRVGIIGIFQWRKKCPTSAL